MRTRLVNVCSSAGSVRLIAVGKPLEFAELDCGSFGFHRGKGIANQNYWSAETRMQRTRGRRDRRGIAAIEGSGQGVSVSGSRFLLAEGLRA